MQRRCGCVAWPYVAEHLSSRTGISNQDTPIFLSVRRDFPAHFQV
jgi:hypothetical protein